MLAGIALMLLTLAIAWLAFDGHGVTLVLIELAAIAAVVIADRLLQPRVDSWLQGARGEESVGAVLDGLRADGWRTIHDVTASMRGNVDHILVGPGGVFAVETKSRRGRVRVDRIDPKWLKQAYAEKKVLETITGLKVQALLVFSDAWLVGRVPARREGVTVLPARMLSWYVSRRRPVMSAEEAWKLHARLATAVGQAAASPNRSLSC